MGFVLVGVGVVVLWAMTMGGLVVVVVLWLGSAKRLDVSRPTTNHEDDEDNG